MLLEVANGDPMRGARLVSDAGIDVDGDGWFRFEDCDDADADVHPGVVDACDGVDQDCDGAVDEDAIAVWYRDADGDGWGSDESIEACDVGVGWSSETGDCDDAASDVFPGAFDAADGVDQDCDGSDAPAVVVPVDVPVAGSSSNCATGRPPGPGGAAAGIAALVARLRGRRRAATG